MHTQKIMDLSGPLSTVVIRALLGLVNDAPGFWANKTDMLMITAITRINSG